MRPDLNKELEERWKEKQAVEITVDETEDPFVPARETTMNEEDSIVHINLC